VVALLLVLVLGLFIYSMPGYMAKKLMGVWERGLCPLPKIIARHMYSLPCIAYHVLNAVPTLSSVEYIFWCTLISKHCTMQLIETPLDVWEGVLVCKGLWYQ
jgi:hypothetical protein